MASGDTLLLLSPAGSSPPASGYATFDTRNSHPCLDFDGTSAEAACWTAVMPQGYVGGGLTVILHCAMTSATSGSVVMSTALERMTGQDIDSDSFATAEASSSTSVAGASGTPFTVTTAHTSGAQMDSVAAGDLFRIKVARVPTDAGDDANGDLELLAIEIRET